eukprot:5435913-Amphidinium_carterae.1
MKFAQWCKQRPLGRMTPVPQWLSAPLSYLQIREFKALDMQVAIHVQGIAAGITASNSNNFGGSCCRHSFQRLTHSQAQAQQTANI